LRRTGRPSLGHYIEFIGWQAVKVVLKIVPRKLMICFADIAGWLMYYVLRVRRAEIDQQLTLAFKDTLSPKQINQIGLRTWQNTVLTFFEFLQPDPIGSKGWDDFIDREGYEEHCVPFIRAGENPLVVTGHLGNWEAMGKMVERERIPIAAVAKPMHNPLVNASIERSRARRGLEVLPLKASMKGIVDAIRKGKWVAFVADQDARRAGIFVEFFNRPASTATGVAQFAYRLNKPMLPTFSVRKHDAQRTLMMVFQPPIYPDPEADKESEIYRMTQEHTRALEDVVRRYPESYFWLHRRWKTQPKIRQSPPR
jgi:KDO2-lipid IV(A) lauroyltransferase